VSHDTQPARDGTDIRALLAARLHPGTLGASLVAGFVVTFALGAAFAELLDGVLEGNGLASVDQPVTRFLVTHSGLDPAVHPVHASRWGGGAGPADRSARGAARPAQPVVAADPAASPGARLQIIHGGGHLFILERPAEVAELVAQFLDSGGSA
jgi:pimeloyl-ACP methyl ester carboxylesterase